MALNSLTILSQCYYNGPEFIDNSITIYHNSLEFINNFNYNGPEPIDNLITMLLQLYFNYITIALYIITVIVIKGRGIIHMAYRRHALVIIITLAATSGKLLDILRLTPVSLCEVFQRVYHGLKQCLRAGCFRSINGEKRVRRIVGRLWYIWLG
jgi:hypothetical protein